MKITFVLGSGFNLSGGDRVIATYAQRLYERGHDVLVITRPMSRPTVREQIRSLVKGQGWIPYKQQPSHFDHLSVPHERIDRFRPVMNHDVPDADVVIATWWETAEWVANLAPAKGAKAYFVQHHEVFDYLPQEKVAATYRLPLHKITIAQWLVDLMRTQYGDNLVSLVPNSIDTKKFYASPRGKQAQPTLGLTYSPLAWKGCDISLKAFALAAQRVPNLRLITFGSSRPSPDLPLPANAEFSYQPSSEEIREFYSQCDAWLFGSRLEGFGLPILEAMACRTPVIGTPTGAAPELLADGAGMLVNMEDPEDMARAIERLCQFSDAEWRGMSDLAYARATSYTIDDAVTRFEAALQTAIERWQRGDFSG